MDSRTVGPGLRQKEILISWSPRDLSGSFHRSFNDCGLCCLQIHIHLSSSIEGPSPFSQKATKNEMNGVPGPTCARSPGRSNGSSWTLTERLTGHGYTYPTLSYTWSSWRCYTGPSEPGRSGPCDGGGSTPPKGGLIAGVIPYGRKERIFIGRPYVDKMKRVKSTQSQLLINKNSGYLSPYIVIIFIFFNLIFKRSLSFTS